jgi:hypothetical protein
MVADDVFRQRDRQMIFSVPQLPVSTRLFPASRTAGQLSA